MARRRIGPKVLYPTKREAELFALQLLRRGMKVNITKHAKGYSVGVY